VYYHYFNGEEEKRRRERGGRGGGEGRNARAASRLHPSIYCSLIAW